MIDTKTPRLFIIKTVKLHMNNRPEGIPYDDETHFLYANEPIVRKAKSEDDLLDLENWKST